MFSPDIIHTDRDREIYGFFEKFFLFLNLLFIRQIIIDKHSTV